MPAQVIRDMVVSSSFNKLYVVRVDGKVFAIDLDADGVPTGSWTEVAEAPLYR